MNGATWTRRAVLAATAVALAGCADESPGEPPPGETRGEPTAEPTPTPTTAPPAGVACADLGDGVVPFDAAGTPLVLAFDYPAVFEEAVAYREPGFVRASVPSDRPGRRLSFGVGQSLLLDQRPTDARLRDAGWVRAGTTRVDETRSRVWKRPDGTAARIGVADRLAYVVVDRGGTERYVRVRGAVRLGADREAVDEDCARAMGRAIRGVFGSLALNEETTTRL